MGIFKKSNKEEKTKKAPVFYKKEQNSSSDIEDINENNEIALEDYYPEETTDYGSESDNPYNEMHEQMHEQDSISIWQDRTGTTHYNEDDTFNEIKSEDETASDYPDEKVSKADDSLNTALEKFTNAINKLKDVGSPLSSDEHDNPESNDDYLLQNQAVENDNDDDYTSPDIETGTNFYLDKFIDSQRIEIENNFLELINQFYTDNVNILTKPVQLPDIETTKINTCLRKLLLLFKGHITLSNNVLLNMGFYLINQEYYDDAVEILGSGIYGKENVPAMRNLLGIAYFRQDDLINAKETFKLNLNEEKYKLHTHFSLGIICYMLDEHKECLANILNVEKELGNQPVFLEAVGLSYYHAGDHDKAIKYLDKYLKKDPGNVEISKAAADILYKKGFFEQAAELYEKIRNETSKMVMYRLSVCLFFIGRHDQARNLLIELLNFCKISISSIQHSLIDLYITAGEYEFFDDHYHEMIYRLLRKESPDRIKLIEVKFQNESIPHTELVILFANTNIEFQEFEKAIAHIELAITNGNKDTRLKRILGKAYLHNEMLEQAFTVFNELESSGERDGEIDYYFAKIYFQQNDFKKCISKMESSLEKQFLEKDIYLFLGFCYFQGGEFASSVESYIKYLSYDKDNLNVINDLGIVYTEMGDYNSAIKTFKKALSIDKDNSQTHLNLGKTYRLILQKASDTHLEEYAKLADEPH